MSLFDGKRLPPATFHLDVDRLRSGWYTDEYFNNVRRILHALSLEGYHYAGSDPHVPPDAPDPRTLALGDAEVDMQVFTKRRPWSVAAGVDHALAMLRECTGYVDQAGRFANTFDRLRVLAVHDGDTLEPWSPAMRIRGRYRDFAVLETPLLGALARRTRIATNVYRTVEAARGKPVLYFPARFDLYETQAGDGYAYHLAVQRYNHDHGTSVRPFVSTQAQGAWWGGTGGGTVSHSYLLCFLRDTPEAMLQFARTVPPESPRVALVDVNNDCVRDACAVARVLFERYRQLTDQGRDDEARRYVLFGVRPDTAADVVDASIQADGDAQSGPGVCPRLVWNIRRGLDQMPERLDLPDAWRDRARAWFRAVRIVATGGFNPERIARFEQQGVPVDIYGVGSYLLEGENNDFTADVVMIKLGDRWIDMAKVGRRAIDNPRLTPAE